jgi:hypothetical protein
MHAQKTPPKPKPALKLTWQPFPMKNGDPISHLFLKCIKSKRAFRHRCEGRLLWVMAVAFTNTEAATKAMHHLQDWHAGQMLLHYLGSKFKVKNELLARFGKHKTGKVYVYIKQWEDIDNKVLATMIRNFFEHSKRLLI